MNVRGRIVLLSFAAIVLVLLLLRSRNEENTVRAELSRIHFAMVPVGARIISPVKSERYAGGFGSTWELETTMSLREYGSWLDSVLYEYTRIGPEGNSWNRHIEGDVINVMIYNEDFMRQTKLRVSVLVYPY